MTIFSEKQKEADLVEREIINVGSKEGEAQSGWRGRDVMNGGAGNDMLLSAEGDDSLSGGAFDDLTLTQADVAARIIGLN